MPSAQLDLRATYLDTLRGTSGGMSWKEKKKVLNKLEGMLENFEEVQVMIKKQHKKKIESINMLGNNAE